MKRIITLFSIIFLLVLGTAADSRAQFSFGFGAGLLTLSSNVQQAGGTLQDQIETGNFRYEDFSTLLGFSLRGRTKFAMGTFRLIGDIAYDYFPNSNVTIAQADSTRATFDVGTSMVPISIGAETILGISALHPYINAQGTLTFIKHTYASGGGGGLSSLNVTNTEAGDNEIGLSVGAGLEFGLWGSWMNIGAQYHLVNLFSQSNNEIGMRYAEIGVSFLFGSLSGM